MNIASGEDKNELKGYTGHKSNKQRLDRAAKDFTTRIKNEATRWGAIKMRRDQTTPMTIVTRRLEKRPKAIGSVARPSELAFSDRASEDDFHCDRNGCK